MLVLSNCVLVRRLAEFYCPLPSPKPLYNVSASCLSTPDSLLPTTTTYHYLILT